MMKKSFARNKNLCSGYTLVELAVVIIIIGIISSTVLIGNQVWGKSLSLSRSIHKLAQDMRRAQEMGMSPRGFGATVPGGYGLYFSSVTPDSYILFADLPPKNQQYDGPAELIEGPIEFETRILIESLSPAPGSELTVIFVPPLPSVVIVPEGLSATITLTNGSRSAGVRVNKVGLIEVIAN